VTRALSYARESQGAFDPTVGPLVSLWGFKYLDYHEPSAADIAAARARVGYAGVEVDAHRPALKLHPGRELDLGAIAKGFAVDRAVASLKAAGMTSIRVDAGGNQGVWSEHPHPWLFGVKHPRREGEVIGAITLDHGGISTSGDAERGFWKDGKRYGHILDPKTGRPVAGMLEVTVAAPTAEEADALSTTLYVLGVQAGTALLAHHPGCAALFIQPGSAPGTYKLTPTPGLAWQPAPQEDPQP
jgi:thiamine biosynthesis lipoprotein